MVWNILCISVCGPLGLLLHKAWANEQKSDRERERGAEREILGSCRQEISWKLQDSLFQNYHGQYHSCVYAIKQYPAKMADPELHGTIWLAVEGSRPTSHAYWKAHGT